MLEDPSFNVCDAEAPASNGSGIFVVWRNEKMKFAFQLADIIYSGRGVILISCLKAIMVCPVVTYIYGEIYYKDMYPQCVWRMSKPFDAAGGFSSGSCGRIKTQLLEKTCFVAFLKWAF